MPSSSAISSPGKPAPARWPWLAYSGLALLILGPLLRPGYVLTLDMVFTPRLRLAAVTDNTYLFSALLRLFNVVLPGDVIQRLILAGTFVAAGSGMHLLARRLAIAEIGAYVAGVLYVLNPFTYDRLMAGQYEVLLGYALLPWAVHSLLAFLERPAGCSAALLAVWSMAISIVSIHTFGMVVLLAAIGSVLGLWRYRQQTGYRQLLLRYGLIATALVTIVSAYWLLPLVLGKGSAAAAVARFGAGDREAFATVGSGIVGRLGNIIRLQGFWAETHGLYTLPQAGDRAWGLLALLMRAIIGCGAARLWRRGNGQRFAASLLGISSIAAIFLAAGALDGWLAAHVPLFAGYREPEKFVAIVALTFAVCTGAGTAAIVRYCQKQRWRWAPSVAAGLLLLVPIVCTPTMLWGAQGQLAAVSYPADWLMINQRLNADHGTFQTLFLPWHLYMYFGFAGRIIANPAPLFFDKPVIASDNPELGNAQPSTTGSIQQSVTRLLQPPAPDRSFAGRLAALHIKYILLAKEDDYHRYLYLNHQPGFRLISSSATLALYRNEALQ